MISDLRGFIVRSGSRWGHASARYAEERLRHLGPARVLERRRNLEILAFDRGAAVPVGEDGLRLWSWGLAEEDGPAALRLAREGRLAAVAPNLWRAAFHLLLDDPGGRLQLVRGEFSPVPVQFARRGSAFFITPELKAFSNLGSLNSVRRLSPGFSLDLNLNTGEFERIDGRAEWPAPFPPKESYEAMQKTFREMASLAVNRAIENSPKPLALALSGGIDSSVVALLAVENGHRPPAFHVSFAPKDGIPASDLRASRRVAEQLGLELREIVAAPEETESLLREMIYRSESGEPWAVEGTLHWLVLGRILEREGFAACLTGNGPDALLGSYVELGFGSDDVPFHTCNVHAVRTFLNPEHENRLLTSFEFKVVSPLKDEAMLEYCLRLPESCLLKKLEGRSWSKSILRDAFAGRLPSDITHDPKTTPGFGNNLDQMLQELHGPLPQRRKNYRDQWRKSLAPRKLGLRDILVSGLKLRRGD